MSRWMIKVTTAGGLFLAAEAHAVTGVAFVHGTGQQTNAAADYWRWDHIDSIRQGLPDQSKYIVVNCNFKGYMWESSAAGCLADHLYPFVVNQGVNDLVVITHSYGGTVMRWMMSNPTWDWRYPVILERVRWVNAIAPTSTGTSLANAATNGTVFESAVGWILGYVNNAVRLQQTHYMGYYNGTWLHGTAGRPTLPKLWSIVGSDVESSPFDSDSYCGDYPLNVGLEITQEWLSSCSDGFIDCSSQAAAGRVWFYDTWWTNGGEPLSHNQSRRRCFGLDVILRNDL